jgi:hypothetical protein
MSRVLLNFQYYADVWSVHFIEADCKTLIGPRTRYYDFATLEGLRAFVVRCNPEDIAEFDRSVRAWSHGSNFVNLTDEQYAKVKQPMKSRPRC